MKHGKILLLISSAVVAVLFFVLVVFTAFAPSYADEVTPQNVDYNFSTDADFTEGVFFTGSTTEEARLIVRLDSPANYKTFNFCFYVVGKCYVRYEAYLNNSFVYNYKTGSSTSGLVQFSQQITQQFDRLDIGFEPLDSTAYIVLLASFCSSDYQYGYYNSAVNDIVSLFDPAVQSLSAEQIQSSYDSGFSAGKEAGLTQSLSNPVSFFLSPLDSFMNIDIFGAFSLGDMFSVILFVCVALIFIKVFAGG